MRKSAVVIVILSSWGCGADDEGAVPPDVPEVAADVPEVAADVAEPQDAAGPKDMAEPQDMAEPEDLPDSGYCADWDLPRDGLKLDKCPKLNMPCCGEGLYCITYGACMSDYWKDECRSGKWQTTDFYEFSCFDRSDVPVVPDVPDVPTVEPDAGTVDSE